MKLLIFGVIMNIFACDGIDSKSPHVSEYDRDSLQMVKTIKDFITWYGLHYWEAAAYFFIEKDSMGNYLVNLDKSRDYLDFLMTSELLTDEYYRLWYEYFEYKAQNFKDFPQDEGPPEGFDFDLVLMNQEPEWVWSNLEKYAFKIKEKSSDTALLLVYFDYQYHFELRKVDGQWKIEYISMAEPD